MGRLKKEPTQIIAIPVDKIPAAEKVLGRKLAINQTPTVKIRVPIADVAKIRKAIK